MAVAFDAFSSNLGGDFTHTPVGTPKAVIVFVLSALNGSGSQDSISITYGGVAMTPVALSPVSKDTGEIMTVGCWFLGSGIPTGAQTVAHGNDLEAMCITLTATSDTMVQDTKVISSDSQANPSGTLSLGGATSFCVMGLISGHSSAASITPLTNWNSRYERGIGAGSGESCGCYTYDIIGTSDVTFGWTQTAEDALSLGVAVTELSIISRVVSSNIRRFSLIRHGIYQPIGPKGIQVI